MSPLQHPVKSATTVIRDMARDDYESLAGEGPPAFDDAIEVHTVYDPATPQASGVRSALEKIGEDRAALIYRDEWELLRSG